MARRDQYDDGMLSRAEQERLRRRDHDAQAQGRAGMRTGLAKSFKQIQDVQVKRGKEATRELARSRARRAKHSPITPLD